MYFNFQTPVPTLYFGQGSNPSAYEIEGTRYRGLNDKISKLVIHYKNNLISQLEICYVEVEDGDYDGNGDEDDECDRVGYHQSGDSNNGRPFLTFNQYITTIRISFTSCIIFFNLLFFIFFLFI